MEGGSPKSPSSGLASASDVLLEAQAQTEKHTRLAGVRIKNAALNGDLGGASTALGAFRWGE